MERRDLLKAAGLGFTTLVAGVLNTNGVEAAEPILHSTKTEQPSYKEKLLLQAEAVVPVMARMVRSMEKGKANLGPAGPGSVEVTTPGERFNIDPQRIKIRVLPS